MDRLIIDTREPFEYQSSHVEGSINIPPAKFSGKELPAELKSVDVKHPIIVYCRTGNRSNVVETILRSHGFSNVTNGINENQVYKLIGKDK